MFRRVFLFLLSLSLSLGEGAVDNRTILSLSLFGGGIVDGNWTTEFAVDKISDNASTPWNLRLNYSVSNHGRNRCLSVEGVFIGGEGSAFKILTRKELNVTESIVNWKTRSKPADFLIIDVSSYGKIPGVNYTSWFQGFSENQIKSFNYLITDDGQVFEGAGWDNLAVYGNGGLEPMALKISFLKEDRYDPPSSTAIDVLKSLVRTAVCLGTLSPNHKLIPYHLIWDPFRLPADNFERKELKEWVQYSADVDLGGARRFPIAFREEYNWTRPLTPLDDLSLPVDLVVVRNFRERCFTTECCVRNTKWYNVALPATVNFLIGDDGRAYEVYGWDYASRDDIHGKSAMVIMFYGSYHSHPPSKTAYDAFNTLLRLGVLWGKVSPDYRVASYRSINNSSSIVGDALHEEVTKMERYVDHV